MTKQQLHSALAPLDVLTRLEMEEIQRKGMDEFLHQQALGVSYKEINGNGDATSKVVIDGPDSGYAWSLKLVAAVLSAAGDVAIFLGDNTTSAPVDGGATVTMAGNNVFVARFTSNVVIIQDNRALTIQAETGTIGAWKVIAKQVPTEMVAKL